MKRVILASASPRRRELLKQAQIDFEVNPSQVEELMTTSVPEELVMSLADQKATDVASNVLELEDDRVVLGADTVVAYDGKILGKPVDDEDAKRMLHMLSGQTHQVYTGCSLISKKHGKLVHENFYEKTDVTMYHLTEEQIDWYVASGEPLDKAGAYGIQGLGAILVESISGDYNNVVGLPLSKVWKHISNAG